MKAIFPYSRNVISIDLGTYETKITRGKQNKDGIHINKAFSFNTPSGAYENGYIKDMGKLLEATKNALNSNNIKSGHCYLTIKSAAAISREIPFPMLGEAELEGILKYQLAEYLPMDSSKYVIQHKVIGNIIEHDSEKINVLVVAIPRDIVDMSLVFVNELGLKAAVMDYHSNGIWKLMNFTDFINDDIAPQYKTIAAIDLGYGNTNITIVKNGVMQTSRVVDLGGEYIEGTMDKIDKIFRYYLSKEANNEIDIILLYGGFSKTKGIDTLFINYFNIPAVVLESIGRVSVVEDVNKYINCIGAILRDDEV